MKMPRNISGNDLISYLVSIGFQKVRQTGSHVRLELVVQDELFGITVPLHDPLKVGTLSNIIKDVAKNRSGLDEDPRRIINLLYLAKKISKNPTTSDQLFFWISHQEIYMGEHPVEADIRIIKEGIEQLTKRMDFIIEQRDTLGMIRLSDALLLLSYPKNKTFIP